MKILCLYISLFICLYSCATNIHTSNQILGRADISEWMDKSNWDRKVFDETKFSPEQLNLIFQLLKNRKIYIFASSNCNECSLSLPYFFKLLTDSKISNEDINLFGLDDYWEEPTGIYKKFDLKEIPLIYITYNDNKFNLTKTEFMNFDIIISKLQSQEK